MLEKAKRASLSADLSPRPNAVRWGMDSFAPHTTGGNAIS